MSQQDQGPVQPLESATTGRGILDKLIGGDAPTAPPAEPGYTDPVAPEVVAGDQSACPNDGNKLDDGVCDQCGFDKAVRLF